ncbi:phosphatase PAP2 family protein [Dialister sp.]|uniref:phosphatase PAP2 family protein n=1 Tax=Dialister sp. TaxID=1955814 RepID=UPI003EFF20E0
MNLQAAFLLYLQENLRTPLLTMIFKFMTSLGNTGFIWIFTSFFLLFKKKTRSIGICALVSILLSFLFTSLILKNIFQEARPFVSYPKIIPLDSHVSSTSFAFPSGHTSDAFAAALLFYKHFPRPWSILSLTAAFLIAFSRLYLGVHYPMDILVGAAAGALSAFLAPRILRRLWKTH